MIHLLMGSLTIYNFIDVFIALLHCTKPDGMHGANQLHFCQLHVQFSHTSVKFTHRPRTYIGVMRQRYFSADSGHDGYLPLWCCCVYETRTCLESDCTSLKVTAGLSVARRLWPSAVGCRVQGIHSDHLQGHVTRQCIPVLLFSGKLMCNIAPLEMLLGQIMVVNRTYDVCTDCWLQVNELIECQHVDVDSMPGSIILLMRVLVLFILELLIQCMWRTSTAVLVVVCCTASAGEWGVCCWRELCMPYCMLHAVTTVLRVC